MLGSWSKSRLIFLIIGVTCVAIGLALIIPGLGS
ncbi:hypothetical protein QF046_003129 [Microbacterium sp. W4I4]|nr:hypothetical protein [Microbacterium sp. W4I4]